MNGVNTLKIIHFSNMNTVKNDKIKKFDPITCMKNIYINLNECSSILLPGFNLSQRQYITLNRLGIGYSRTELVLH